MRLARELLGKVLVRRIGRKEIRAVITETEAYHGLKDKASHAARGKTKRNAPMWGAAGHWYVYFVYGNHWMLNLVTGPEEYPAAILIRGISKIKNQKSKFRRSASQTLIKNKDGVVSGPGRVAKFLKIDGSLSGRPASRKTGLWIEDGGEKIKPSRIKAAARVGVNYAGKEWAGKKWRFKLL